MKYIRLKVRGKLYECAKPDILRIHIRTAKMHPPLPSFGEECEKSFSPAETDLGECPSFSIASNKAFFEEDYKL